MATLPTFAASASPATTVLSGGPAVHEQQALSEAIPIAVGNVHTTITTTPGLTAHNYLVALAIGVDDLAPGAKVLCGFGPSGPGDTGTSNYGEVDNFGTTATGGNCVATDTVTLTTSNDHIFAWATVYSGPGGAPSATTP